jgi:RNA polymerase sigma-70 factor (ECF subfamily)
VGHYSSLDDKELVAAALRDRNAFAQIVRRYEAPLARYVQRLLGGTGQSAEDVLQDVFLKVYVNLNDYDRTRAFGPWIYRIAHNEAMSFLRRRSGEAYVISGEEGMLLLDRALDGFSALDALDRSRIEAAIRKAIGGLDLRYRDALLLRFLEEKSYEEVADILEIPMGTVATLIDRGRKRLRQSLEKIGVKP